MFNFYSLHSILVHVVCVFIHPILVAAREKKNLRKTKFTAGYFWVEKCVYALFFLALKHPNGIGYFQPATAKQWSKIQAPKKQIFLVGILYMISRWSEHIVHTMADMCTQKHIKLKWILSWMSVGCIFAVFIWRGSCQCAVFFFILEIWNIEDKIHSEWLLCEDRVKSHNNFLRGRARQGKKKKQKCPLIAYCKAELYFFYHNGFIYVICSCDNARIQEIKPINIEVYLRFAQSLVTQIHRHDLVWSNRRWNRCDIRKSQQQNYGCTERWMLMRI